ncbi:MAG: hypothetical protein OXP66_05090 [Candidatus Tectomicrobia bacterium]|nr:hypothetical protein [Candidatus Tectomicrobia bacterium]
MNGRNQILDLAAESGPVIEVCRVKGLGLRRIATLLNLNGYSPSAVRPGT